MIPKEELRIGNLVHYVGTDDVQVVQGVDQENVFLDCLTADYVEFEEIFPIEITEEWLLKFGFKEHKTQIGSRFRKKNFYITKNVGFDLFLKEVKSGIYFHLKGLRYVHELQNLYFALERKELEYDKTKIQHR